MSARYVSSQRRTLSGGSRRAISRATGGTGVRDFNPAGGMPTNAYGGDYGVLGRCTELAENTGVRCQVPGGVTGRCPTHERVRALRQQREGREAAAG